MFSEKLSKLKDYNFSTKQISLLNNFLTIIIKNNIHRFSPSYFSKEEGITIDNAQNMLMKASQIGAVQIYFEVECPEGDSDFYVTAINEIDWANELQCRVCDNAYTPSPDHIWVTFGIQSNSSCPKVQKPPESTKSHSGGFLLKELIISQAYHDFIPSHLVNIDLSRYNDLLTKVETAITSGTNKEKGDTLEELADYLFKSIRAFQVGKRTNTATSEIDRFLKVSKIPGTFFQDWSSYAPIECKNWSSRVGKPVINDLYGRAVNMKSNVGILFSRQGVTGNMNSDGWRQIINLFNTERYVTIVITIEDLKQIGAGFCPLTLIEDRQASVHLGA
jgi:hypothetical protein